MWTVKPLPCIGLCRFRLRPHSMSCRLLFLSRIFVEVPGCRLRRSPVANIGGRLADMSAGIMHRARLGKFFRASSLVRRVLDSFGMKIGIVLAFLRRQNPAKLFWAATAMSHPIILALVTKEIISRARFRKLRQVQVFLRRRKLQGQDR